MNYSKYNVKFTKRDHEIMDSYARTVADLGKYLGTGYELILHSLENCQKSAVVVINGFHTGRKVGAPITDLAINMLQQFLDSGTAEGIVYFTKNQKGDPLKSTTIPIQGENGNIIGMLCINFYLNSPFSVLIDELTPKIDEHKDEAFFAGSENSKDLLYDLLTQTRNEVYGDADIPYNCKNKEIVQRLYAQGAFTLKNAVKIVSDYLGVSRNTIYLHIRNADK